MSYNTPLKNTQLRAPKAPNLPIAPVEYSQQYVDQLSNALRLYFGQLDNITQALTIPDSGVTADRPISTTLVKLQIGQYYFDTTIGRPIWWNGTNWINAAGTIV
jgi:hypothetical protein